MSSDVVLTVQALRARVRPENAQWIIVKSGEHPQTCKSCDADKLYWSRTGNGKPLLVDCGVDGAYIPDPQFPAIALAALSARFERAAKTENLDPSHAHAWAKSREFIDAALAYHEEIVRRGVQLLEGRGVAHFATCPRGASFRKR